MHECRFLLLFFLHVLERLYLTTSSNTKMGGGKSTKKIHKKNPQELEEQLYLVQQRYALELERSLQYSRAIAKPSLLVANSGLAAQTAATRGMRP